MGYQLGSRLEQNGSTLWHRCLQPKSLHCETEEDVGLVVTIGFHQMGGPWRKKEPWKRAWGLCELQRHLSNQPGLPVLVYACDNHNRSKGERREKYQDMIRNHRNGNTERSWTVADEQQSETSPVSVEFWLPRDTSPCLNAWAKIPKKIDLKSWNPFWITLHGTEFHHVSEKLPGTAASISSDPRLDICHQSFFQPHIPTLNGS